jgi:hypothetical protein
MNKDYELQREEQNNNINNALKEMEINFNAEFVPFSKSRNAKENPKIDDLSINWKVTISRGRSSLTTDYMQGIGHLPNSIKPSAFKKMYVDQANNIKSACETGKYPKANANWILSKINPPTLTDVLYSLLMDSDVLNYGTFEEWAGEFGYETDSRKAEKMYNECMKIALKMRAMFGDENIQKLNELYQNF